MSRRNAGEEIEAVKTSTQSAEAHTSLWKQLLQEGLHYCGLVFAWLKITPAHSSKQQSQLLSSWTESSQPANPAALRIWLAPDLVALCTYSETRCI